MLPSPVLAASLTRGPYLQSGSSTSMVVRWRTDVPTDSFVRFRSTGQSEVEVRSTATVTNHEILLTALPPDTLYFYSIGFASNTLAGGADCYFRTSPTNSQPVRVWAIGDAGVGTSNQFAVRDAYLSYTNNAFTDVWLMLGDNAYELGDDDDFHNYVFAVYPETFRRAVAWPAIGNHDVASGKMPIPFLEMFTFTTNAEAGGVPSRTELYYSFDYANVHFISLDSEVSDSSDDSAMLRWLRADLSATSKDWIIAYWHHPPYSMGTDFSDSTAKLISMRERVNPILESYGVDLVLSGHSHVYERSFLINGHYGYSWDFSPDHILDSGLGRPESGGPYRKPAGGVGANRGTVYLVCGNSGQGGAVNFNRHPAMAVKFDGYGSVVLDIDGLRLDAKYLRPSGAIDDHFTIDKSTLPNFGPSLNMTRDGSALWISWPTSLGGFKLESASTLPTTNWHRLANQPLVIGRSNYVQVSATQASSFYRLKAP